MRMKVCQREEGEPGDRPAREKNAGPGSRQMAQAAQMDRITQAAKAGTV